MIDPALDGIDHINVYSKGQTELGRFLSNFTKCDLELPDGNFKSVEGYWYWLNTNPGLKARNELMNVWGFEAKRLGRKFNTKDWNEEDNLFKIKIKFAIFTKLINNTEYFKQVKLSNLPFVHYYNYSGKIIEPKEGKWIIDFLNSFRLERLK